MSRVRIEIDENTFDKARGLTDLIIKRSAHADEGCSIAACILMHVIANNSGIGNAKHAGAVVNGIAGWIEENFETVKEKYKAAGIASGGGGTTREQ